MLPAPLPPPPAIAALTGAIPAPAPTEIGLVDGTGRPMTLAELRGRYVWLYLGYASCPDACPRTLGSMVGAYAALPKAVQERVVPVFVSVDPMRDTPARLKAYTGFFHPRLQGLSGPHQGIDALVAALGTRYQIPKGAKPDQMYAVAHPDEVFVFDPKGRYVARLGAGKGDIETALGVDLAARLAAPETETSPPPPPPPGTADAWCALPTEEALADPDPNKDPRMHRAATMGSGTSVLPATTPMRMWAFKTGSWLWMAHLDAVAGFTQQTGPRGGSSHVAENWQMLMGSRYLGPGLLDVRMMTSLEPFTTPLGGTPQLFQSGETFQNRPLLDRQHPHDLLGELSARYTWTPSPLLSVFAYGGLAGEPALGPAAYMHRPSSADNHWAPLGHHYQDATHVSYGVVTTGARLGAWQWEASAFNGREPDENRFDIDWGPLDSWSTRLSWFPGRHWVAQLSHGYLRSPSPSHPGDEARTSASLTSVANTALGRWSNTLVWGQNAEFESAVAPPDVRQSYALESQLDWAGRHHAYGRYELLDRAGLPPRAPASHTAVRVNALTLGYTQDLGPIDRWALGLGGDVTVYSLEALTRGAYGENPLMARVFLRLRPPTMTHMEDRDAVADGPPAQIAR
ncbi:MAG: SCO family protein [Candidatus Sericytochromatia bacterium]|nr:SCO family protein [Candidatus Sericytochromatia bacterium]